MDEVLRPYHHTAPVAGRLTTFCMLEYPKEFPPAVIEVDGVRWVREDAKTETERDGRR